MSSGEREASDILGELQGKGDQFTKMCVIERKRLADLEDAIEHINSEIIRYRERCNSAAVALMNHQSLAPNPSFTKADASDVSRYLVYLMPSYELFHGDHSLFLDEPSVRILRVTICLCSTFLILESSMVEIDYRVIRIDKKSSTVDSKQDIGRVV